MVPHIKSAITSQENYADLATGYDWPNHSKVVCAGLYVHDCIHGSYGKVEEVDKTHGKVTKIQIRNAKTNRKKSVKPANAVVVPPLKAFVRNRTNKFWYQIKSNKGKKVVLRLILSKPVAQPEEPTDLTTEESLESKTQESNYEPAAAATNQVNDPADAVITCPVQPTHPHPKTTVHPVAVAQFVPVTDAKTVPDVTVPYDSIMARTVIEDPDVHLPPFLDHWVENKPDTSEGRPPNVSELGFWKSLCALLKAHTDFPGLCAKWLHIAFDFAIAQNQWPVRFKRNGETYDMVVPFIFTAWVCYCAQMNGSPDLTSKACQKVFSPCNTQIRL